MKGSPQYRTGFQAYRRTPGGKVLKYDEHRLQGVGDNGEVKIPESVFPRCCTLRRGKWAKHERRR
jgi:hypothetical protein